MTSNTSKVFAILCAAFIFACSSSSTTTAGCTTQECLDQLNGEAGSSAAGSSSSTVGGDSSTGGNSSSTLTSTGGSTSTATSSSTGGSVSTSTCIPKTCAGEVPAWIASDALTKPTACGVASDGCGGLLQCGNCTTDGTANTDCGQAPPTGQGSGYWAESGLVPTANVCGTRCIQAPIKLGACDNGIDYDAPGYQQWSMWLCPSSIPPLGLVGCKSINSSSHTWCCDR